MNLNNSLSTFLRLSEVSRWGIIGVLRPQSVAEHSFQVLLIALNLYDCAINGLSHNSFDRTLLIEACLVHDLLETVTGDLPAPFKRELEEAVPGTYDTLAVLVARHHAEIGIDPETLMLAQSTLASLHGTWLKPLLKIADLLESIIYIETWGRHHDQRTLNVQLALEKTLTGILLQGAPPGTPGDPKTTWDRLKRQATLILETSGGGTPLLG